MFMSQIWGTIIGKSPNRHCQCLGFDVIHRHSGCIVNYGAHRGELALSSGADGLLIT
jgi:hypothetical protein